MDVKRQRDPYLRSLIDGTEQAMKLLRVGLCSDEQVEEHIARLTKRFFYGQRKMGRIK